MKKIISLLLTITMAFCIIASIPLNASAVTTDKAENSLTYTDKYGNWTYELTDNGEGYRITDYDQSMTNIKIPSVIDNIPVLEIGAYAFWDCNNVTNITIPNGITSIGEYAFWNCNSITNITIPESVTYIHETAFLVGEKFTDIYVSPNNEYFSSIDGVLFDKNQSIIICYPCARLSESYVIPETVNLIGCYAFASAFYLTNITIPDSVIVIGSYGFINCVNLMDITIPNSVTIIENYAFYGCSSLTEITIPDSVTYIRDLAFSDCIALTNITIPDSVISIGTSAFSDCSSLTEITLPNSITTINQLTFSNCSSLTKITIPDSVTEIKHLAFDACDNLNNVYYTGNENQWNNITIGLYNDCLTNSTINYNYVPPVAGDANSDNQVSIIDVIYVLKYIVGGIDLTTEQFTNADLNGDGKLTILDAIMVQRLVLNAD